MTYARKLAELLVDDSADWDEAERAIEAALAHERERLAQELSPDNDELVYWLITEGNGAPFSSDARQFLKAVCRRIRSLGPEELP